MYTPIMHAETADRYSRISRLYDLMEWPMEMLLLRRLRRESAAMARGRTLEVGVGTGKNLSFYPDDLELHAVDFSPGMLVVARGKARESGLEDLTLSEMDLQHLSYEDEFFDTVISTFVFCTVPDPLAGLREVRRVLRTGGRAIFLEHMKSRSSVLNLFLGLMSIFTWHLLGTSMLRETRKNIETAGFEVISSENRLFDVVRLITVEKQSKD